MISSLVALILIGVAVLGSSAMVGVLAYFLHRLRRLEDRISSARDGRRVAQEERLHEELLSLRGEMLSLQERLDFMENLLSPAREKPDSPAGGADDPGPAGLDVGTSTEDQR